MVFIRCHRMCTGLVCIVLCQILMTKYGCEVTECPTKLVRHVFLHLLKYQTPKYESVWCGRSCILKSMLLRSTFFHFVMRDTLPLIKKGESQRGFCIISWISMSVLKGCLLTCLQFIIGRFELKLGGFFRLALGYSKLDCFLLV